MAMLGRDKVAGGRRPVVRLAMLLLLSASVAAACTSGGDAGGSAPEPRPKDVQSYTGPSVQGAAHPIGLKWDWSTLDRYLPFVKDLAGGATFYEFEWCQVEPRQGQLDWGVLDRVVRSGRRLGYEMMLKIRVGSCWATGGRRGEERGEKRKTVSAMPRDLAAYQAFVRTVVERYRPLGVRQYAIENEVNARNFWDGTPQQYEQLVRLGAQAVHAADPKAEVLDSGIASPIYGVAIAERLLSKGRDGEAVAAYQRYYARRGSQYRRVETVAELRSMLGRGLVRRGLDYLAATQRLAREKAFDVYQLHFYEPWDNVPALLDYVRATLPSSLPIEAWEVGMFQRGAFDQRGDQQLLAGEAAKEVSLLLAGGVRRVVWLPLAAPDGASELRFGLLDAGGGVRPAGEVVKRLAAASEGATWRGVTSGEASGVAFGKGSKTTLVLWSEHGAIVPGAARSGANASTLGGASVQWGEAGLRLGREPFLVSVPLTLDEAARLVR
jgi:hypothetical protein